MVIFYLFPLPGQLCLFGTLNQWEYNQPPGVIKKPWLNRLLWSPCTRIFTLFSGDLYFVSLSILVANMLLEAVVAD